MLLVVVVVVAALGPWVGASAEVTTWTVAGFPNPTVEPGRCGRPEGVPSRICDPDRLLSRAEGAAVEAKIEALAQARNGANACASMALPQLQAGIEASVVLVRKFDAAGKKDDDADVEAAAEALARGLHDAWGVGDVETQNGVLIFVGVEDRVVYISTGLGVKAVVTRRRAQRVVGAMKPSLRAEKYGAAALAALDDIDRFAWSGPPSSGEWLWVTLPALVFCGVFAAIVAAAAHHTWRQVRARGDFDAARTRLEALDRIRERAANGEVSVPDSCPICLEAFMMMSPKDEDSGGDGDDDHHRRESTGLVHHQHHQHNGTMPCRGSDCKPIWALDCGHCFDQTCLEEWIRSSAAASCPICRRPIGDHQVVVGPTAVQGTSSSSRVVDDGEVRFRLHRLHRQYPHYVRSDHIHLWTRPTYRGSFARDSTFLSLRPKPATTNASSSSSSSRSFGGGSSSGGGGGRW